jgi:lysyl-tRNA synthetase class 2
MENHYPIVYMSKTVQDIRSFLLKNSFIELTTPIIRKLAGFPYIPRIQLDDGRYLREAPALALRKNLAYAPKIFEIAPCMRRDQVDDTHLQQFTMLDLYEMDATIDDAIRLCTQLISQFYHGTFKSLSVAKQILVDLNVDLFDDPEALLHLQIELTNAYGANFDNLTDMLNQYIVDEIEPKSKGCCLIVTDFPTIAEVMAAPKSGTFAVTAHSEFQINGIEVVNLYQDDPNIERFKSNSKKIKEQYNPEIEIICDLIDQGKLTPYSSGFGIGIERLCQVCLDLPSIKEFIVSPEFIYKFIT